MSNRVRLWLQLFMYFAMYMISMLSCFMSGYFFGHHLVYANWMIAATCFMLMLTSIYIANYARDECQRIQKLLSLQ